MSEIKEVIQDNFTGLTGIFVPLDSLRELYSPDSSISAAGMADLEKAGVANALNRCGDLCDDFAKRLDKLINHSSGPKLSFRDRLTASFNKGAVFGVFPDDVRL